MNENSYLALAAAVWSAIAGLSVRFIHCATRKPNPPPEPLPPGYGEQYRYRSYFDPDDTPNEQAILRPMPEDLWDEPTNTIEAYRRFTACRVCGYRARICSSEACPQRRSPA